MTITETRPEAAPTPDATTAAGPPAGNWFTTGDHKRLGLLFFAGGVAALLAGCVAAVLFPVMAEGVDLWTRPVSRLASANVTYALVIGIPALWIGLATMIVPLQIGATRLALPRLHALALWAFAVGGVLVTIAYLADRPAISGLGSSVPAQTNGNPAGETAELLVTGLAVVGVATVLAAVSLLTTILTRRGDGVRIVNVPLFTWSTLATSSVLLLTTPVFLAGLALLWWDQHYGGTFFATGLGSLQTWQHQLWIAGRPEALLFAAAALGLLGDVVSTHARKPLVGHAVARAVVTALPFVTLIVWAQRTSALRSPVAPTATPVTILAGLVAGLVVLTWLGTLRPTKGGRPPRAHPSFVGALGVVLLLAGAAAMAVVAALAEIDNPIEAEAFRNGQITLLTFGAPLVALAGATAHWGPKAFGKSRPAVLGAVQSLLLLGGTVLLAASAYAVGLGADADSLRVLGLAGSIITALGLLALAANLAGGSPAAADPYDGLTLEWATPTPLPAHNFDTLPPVHSPYPLHDRRTHEGETA